MVRTVVRLAGRARALRITGAVAALVVLFFASVMGVAAVDAVVRFPGVLRGIMLAVIAGFMFVDMRKVVLPAFRFRPQPVDIALRIERMRPELQGKLASAVEFELSGAARGSALAARAIRDAEDRSSGASLGKVIRWKPMGTRFAAALLCVGSAIGFAIVEPDTASIAARRVLMPWSDAVWPARTALAGMIVDGSVAARGRPLALRARMTEGEAERERVRAEYRVTRDGVVGDWIEVGLARQPSGEFERFVDADGERIEVRFMTSDATTEIATVRLVAPPAIASAQARIEPPAYAARAVQLRVEDLGDCSGSRGILRDPILAGSQIVFDLRMTRALAFDPAHSPLKQVSSSGTEPGATTMPVAIVVDEADGAHWTVSCTAVEATRLALTLIDSDGIAGENEIVLAFDTIADRPPSATIVEPVQDESVVVDARIAMRADARDDIGLAKAGIEIATRIGKDSVESMVFEEPAQVMAGANGEEGSATEASVERMLDIANLKLSAGDSIVLRAYAQDAFEGGTVQPAHERVRSAPRILRIVGDDEFERQIRGVFAGVRRDAMRVDERQAKARDAVERDPSERGLAELQAAVTEGAARMREATEQAIARLEKNDRANGVLSELAEQARELTAAAESRSAEASGAVERAREQKLAAEGKTGQEQAAAQAAAQDAAKSAAEIQDAVRAELEDLVALLDRDEDSWIAKRRLDALANKIRQSARETDQAARRSNGEGREELSPDARAEIDALADKQQQEATEAEQVVQELKERSQALKDADPQQSRALEEAAKAAEDGKVREELEQAAKDSSQNRLAQSKQAQDRAASALQKAAEALNEDRKVHAEELARQLESLADSIRRLIKVTENVRDEVAAAGDGNDADADAQRERAALGAGKLSQNTRGVASDARATGREAARVARTLDGAAGSLAKVAGNLRGDPFDRNDTTLAVDSALKSLNDALVDAEQAADRAEERAEEEKREELLVKYRDFLERQAALRGSVEKIVPADAAVLGRRELIESRRLGTAQEELRLAIAELRAKEEDVQGSDALVEMHDAIDAAFTDAKASLSGGRPAEAMPGEDDAVAALSAIVVALDENDAPKNDEDKFGEQEADQGGDSGGSGGQSGGAVPPAAEIKLLRAMQDSLAKRTRLFAERASELDVTTRSQRLAEIAVRQQRIVELGSKIAEKISPKESGPTITPPVPPVVPPAVPPAVPPSAPRAGLSAGNS
ncbi:MAG: hypothetical protein WCI96_04075, partial [Planctomycetota bacterium]